MIEQRPARILRVIWTASALLATAFPCAAQSPPPSQAPTQARFRVYTHLLDPHEHPDYERRAVRPPSWDTFKQRTQFTCLRGFNVEGERIVGYSEELEKFSRAGLGNVIWPSYPILFATNLAEVGSEMQRRGLYLFDVWGYVPGSGPGGYWQQFTPPKGAFTTLESQLGDHWLGTDIGEQDGRYIGGYADQMTPSSASRFEQYLNFQRHFERMSDDLGHKHAMLVSLNYGHYLLKEGTFTLIGAETAQALPNNQVYYAFIRGAGKEYGVPWFGNASIFNRWGFKTYGSSGKSDGYEHGPSKGTSLSLLKRLLYSHILYNSVAVGFENGWFDGQDLSPIGRIQKSAAAWVDAHGQPGVMQTPVALLLDFYSGWTFPRHLYSDKTYRVWGNLPYGEGDYLTDAVLGLLYPGYQDSSFFHDESGFITATPHGDSADCVLSDAPRWLLARYPLLIVAGEIQGGRELRDKFQEYIENGGHLVIPAVDLVQLPGGLAGITNATTMVSTNLGKGQLTVFGPGFGLDLSSGSKTGFASHVDKLLAKPYQLAPAVRDLLEKLLDDQQLFRVGAGLSCIACRKGPGEYTLGILNNSWHELPLEIKSQCGPSESLVELPLDDSEKSAVGYLPETVDARGVGRNSERTIAGGDVRIFSVHVKESGVEEMPHLTPPRRPRNRAVPLRKPTSIKEAILARPTFFEHFDSVVVDGNYLHEREPAALEGESGWLKRQAVRVYVDLSSSIDLYPELRLIDNLQEDYQGSLATIRDVLAKMQSVGARDLLLSLHRYPENNFTGAQTEDGFVKTLRIVAKEAAQRQMTVYLRVGYGKPPWNLTEANALLDRVGEPNLRLAVNTAVLATTRPSDAHRRILNERLGLWLVAAPRFDVAGRLWNAHAPIYQAPVLDGIAQWLSAVEAAPRILDAIYSDADQEYLDARMLDQLVKGNAGP